MTSRKNRRRLERGRLNRRAARPVSLPARILSAVVGVVLIVAGIFLLTHPVTTSSSRLARVAGIMIVMGLVALALAAFGRF